MSKLILSLIGLALFSLLSSCQDRSSSKDNQTYSIYLGNSYSHPLVCGQNSEFPNSKEIILVKKGTGNLIHGVISNTLGMPEKSSKLINIEGSFRNIDRSFFKLKVPPKDYKVLIVRKWAYQE